MSQPVRIPADIDREDHVLANLTARQLLLLAGAGTLLYGTWTVAGAFVPVVVFLLAAVPFAGAAAYVALGRRDGLSMDRLLMAALRQRTTPRLMVTAPEGILSAPAWLGARVNAGQEHLIGQAPAPGDQLPAEGVSETGVIDLGTDGVAAVAVCSTLNFALRTPTEQEALVGAFGRYLHSLTAPIQVLVRAEPLDLTAQIAELVTHAAGLPHPALEAAAREHADYLGQLARSTVLLRRQVLLILREPLSPALPADGLVGASRAAFAWHHRGRHTGQTTEAAGRAAETRLARRLAEATELLDPSGITVTPLNAGQATAVLAAACNPDTVLPVHAYMSPADDVITTVAGPDDWPAEEDPERYPDNSQDSWSGRHSWTATP